ncbi:GCN5-related N-acetyltransferase [Naegleria gruberi]|uniref:GCN5-related N-acetyltransferase n=1 Tax=Naegleria gruberi TaxID=5762 RepID=D2V3H8_NAEGR|nr:GCN5-related N-acetyltransferase [Naegleria gruberi]EFC48774.1 GCN5-related N-acetyltransferase [Naegleria gruberi]|eukprot:XP_002681518.1 GCN5-related N-acetyltransferase [Naegleria gruberi strain NEG-M]
MNKLIIDGLFDYNTALVKGFPSVFDLYENENTSMPGFKKEILKKLPAPELFYVTRSENSLQFMETVREQSDGVPVYLFIPMYDSKNRTQKFDRLQKTIFDKMPISWIEVSTGMICDLMESRKLREKILEKLKNEFGFIEESLQKVQHESGVILAQGKDFVIKTLSTSEEAVEIAETYYEAFYGEELPKDASQLYAQYVLKSEVYEWVIVKKDGRVVACGQLIKGREISSLFSITTRPDYQGQGFASLVVTLLLEIALLNNYKYCVLHATMDGRPIYEKIGFEHRFDIQVIGTRKDFNSVVNKVENWFGIYDIDYKHHHPVQYYGKMIGSALLGVGLTGLLGYSLVKYFK